MGITKRILLSLFGFLSGLFGFLSLLVAIMIIIGEFFGTVGAPDNSGTTGRIFWIVWLFILAELFLAFGVAASLLALRCLLGPKPWIIKTINFFWSRAVKFALIMPILGTGSAIVFWIVKFFIS